MTNPTTNPWVERFATLLNKDVIRKKVEVQPRPFPDYDQLSPVEATKELEKRFNEAFFASNQSIDILHEWVSLALAHCQNHYYGHREFLAALYSKETPLPDFNFPMCLTGLAGIGKSQLLKALGRLMPGASLFSSIDNTSFALESHRVLTVKVQGAATVILESLTGQSGGIPELTRVARKRAYRDGWALLGLDEFQFLTQSDKANTRLMQVLMSVCYIGIPVVYVANFSMLHKLIRRNHEDRQRLLSNVWGLHPESPNSSDWTSILKWHKRIVPDVFEFDAEADAQAIHQLTAGLNRAENKLLAIAFRRATENGKTVGLRELEAAYKSRDYAIYRKDIELISKLPYSTVLQKSNKDLWCPFDIAPCVEAEEHSAQRQEYVNEAAINASLNAAERKALKAVKRNVVKTNAKPTSPKQKTSTIVSIENRKSLAEQLKEDAAWFDENL